MTVEEEELADGDKGSGSKGRQNGQGSFKREIADNGTLAFKYIPSAEEGCDSGTEGPRYQKWRRKRISTGEENKANRSLIVAD